MIAESNAHPVRIALLGCGTVGAVVAHAIIDDASRLTRIVGRPVQLARVLVRDLEKDRGLDRALLTDRFEAILDDESIDVVIELIGGLEPTLPYVERLLARGIGVVSANKTLVAHHGSRLCALAAEHGTRFRFEAAVGAATPVLAVLRALQGDRCRRVSGVLNGSCNFILSVMAERGSTLADALAEAGRLGLVEPDPTADLSGRDSAEKLVIIARQLGLAVDLPQVEVHGIEDVAPADLGAARARGCALKLVADLEIAEDGRARAAVGPAFVPRDHPLARVRGCENAIVVRCDRAGDVVVHGRGAGPEPTCAAVLSDLVEVLGVDGRETKGPGAQERGRFGGAAPRACYVRFRADAEHRRPADVLRLMRRHCVPVAHLSCGQGEVSLETTAVDRARLRAALREVCDSTQRPGAFIAPRLDEPGAGSAVVRRRRATSAAARASPRSDR